jgi:hypothetical protein
MPDKQYLLFPIDKTAEVRSSNHPHFTIREGISPVNHILLPLMHEICVFHPLSCLAQTSRFLTGTASHDDG